MRLLGIVLYALGCVLLIACLYELGILPPLFVTIPAPPAAPVVQTAARPSTPVLQTAARPSAPPPQFTSSADPYDGLPPAKAQQLRELDRERDQAIAVLQASSLDAIAKQYAINEIRAEYQARTAQLLQE